MKVVTFALSSHLGDWVFSDEVGVPSSPRSRRLGEGDLLAILTFPLRSAGWWSPANWLSLAHLSMWVLTDDD